MLRFSGGRWLGLRSALTIAIAAGALSMVPSAAQAAFTLQPCHGSGTAGRGATFPALLHNGGFWGAGFDSASDCAGTTETHPTYNSAPVDATGAGVSASKTGSGAGVGACGGGSGGWPIGHRDSNVRFCATDDPLTPTQLQRIDNGADQSTNPVVTTPGLIHQIPWASGAVTVILHLPEGCQLPAPGTAGAATSPTTGWTNSSAPTTDPSGDTVGASTTRPYISDQLIEAAFAGKANALYWGQLIPGLTGAPVGAASGDKQDVGLTCNGTTAGTGIPVIRIVRSDNSGTSFNFKAFLGTVNGGLGNDPTNPSSWTGSNSTTGGSALGASSPGGQNTAWPASGSFAGIFDAGASGHQTDATNICQWSAGNGATPNPDVVNDHICGGHNTGGGNVAGGVLATDGSIGYVDIATARNSKLAGAPAAQQDFQDDQTGGPAPTGVTAADHATGGTFGAGTYFYVVSAVTPSGESIGSTEAKVTIPANDQVDLSWNAVAGATAYKIYRSTTSGGEFSTTPNSQLVTTVSGGSTTTFTDPGSATTGGHAIMRDSTFWIPLQNNPDQASGNTYVEPTKDQTNHLGTSTGTIVGTQGANCSTLPNLQNVPTAANSPQGDATLGDWSKTVAVGGSGYPACVLTYGLIWDDNSKVYGNTPTEEAQARTVLDYVNFIESSFGQSFLATDFSAPPASIRNIAKTGTPDGTGTGGIAAIGWNKSTCTSNCSTSTTTISTTSTTTTTTTTPVVVSNQFTVSGLKVKAGALALTLKLPGSGRISVLATFRFGRKTITFASIGTSVPRGTGTVTLKPSNKARSALSKTLKTKTITVTLQITYTPNGGKPNTKFGKLTIKGTKNPLKKKRKH